jgi:PAS domain S-box-containing protein
VEASGQAPVEGSGLGPGELASLFLAMNHAAILSITDPAGTITWVNDKFCDISGYTRDELLGQNHRMLNSGLHPAEFFAGMWRTLGEGRVWRGLIRNRAKGGRFYWVDSTITPTQDARGALLGFLSIRVDITEQVTAQEDLKKSEQARNEKAAFVRSIFDCTNSAMAVVDAQGRILDVNDAWCRFARDNGADAETIRGIGTLYFREGLKGDNSEGLDAIHAGIRSVQQGTLPYFQVEYPCDSETTQRWFTMGVSPMPDHPGTVLISHQDITRRRRMEEYLRQASAAVEQSCASIFITNTSGTIEYVNAAFTEGTGYAAGEVLGRKPDILKSGEHTSEFYRDLWNTLAGGRVWRGRFHNRRKNGELTWEQSVISPLRDSGGRISHYVVSSENVTEALVLAEENQLLKLQFAQSQKMESLGSLAGGIAHDMNNVLGAILVIASANQEQQPEGSPLYQAMATIAKAAARGGQMVKSLLKFARLGSAEPAETMVDLSSVIQEVAQLLAWTTLSRVALRMELASDLRPIRGDATRLIHALMNLCVNAVDSMGGNGTLTLRTRNAEAGWIEVLIEDNGCGMSPEVLARVLDPFFTTKEAGKGTGLGLSMVQTAVQAHQGVMAIRSEPGAGTCVSLRFPALPCQDPASEAMPGAAPGTARPALSVLLVDDDDLVRNSVADLLTQLGHSATAFSRGELALAELERPRRYDVVMLDLNMPGLGGAGTLPRLRALCPGLPVILTTGSPDQTAVDLVKAFPKVTLLSKPFTKGHLQIHLECAEQA